MSSGDIFEDDNICSICSNSLSLSEIETLICGHRYHMNCWLETQQGCSNCNYNKYLCVFKRSGYAAYSIQSRLQTILFLCVIISIFSLALYGIWNDLTDLIISTKIIFSCLFVFIITCLITIIIMIGLKIQCSWCYRNPNTCMIVL